MEVNKGFFKKIIYSRIFLFFAIIFLIFLIINVGEEGYRQYQLNKEISKLKSESQKLENSNQELLKLLDYINDESNLEKEARLKLNLRKPGERVVILLQENLLENNLKADSGATVKDSLAGAEKNDSGNFWKWWEYFFSNSSK